MNGAPADRQPKSFGRFVDDAQRAGRLVVQPRTGYCGVAGMRKALLATKRAAPITAGTITVDSYTRVGDYDAARRAMAARDELNGFPLVAHGRDVTRTLLSDVRDDTFPVQVRHGSAHPMPIFAAMRGTGLDATEGGPVSYCLPYGRTPLAESVRNWSRACEYFAAGVADAEDPHLETFGGCLLGQLCPPSLLVALSVLEGMFFRAHGLRSISLSYAQQTDHDQDLEAVGSLRALARQFLDDVDWHIVVYTYMGRFPETRPGAESLLEAATRLAKQSGAARLIVKTAAEAHRIPTVDETVTALRIASVAGEKAALPRTRLPEQDTETCRDARALIEAVLDVDDDIGDALTGSFARGVLDVPYCLHPDNAGRTRAVIDARGRLAWSDTGSMPIRASTGPVRAGGTSSAELLAALSYVARKHDRQAARSAGGRRPAPGTAAVSAAAESLAEH